MTLFEFFKLLKRNLPWLIVIPIIFAFLGVGYVVMEPKSYTATATLLVSSEANGVGGIAEQIGKSDAYHSQVSVSTNATKKMISVTATGANEKEVVQEANDVVIKTQDQLFPMYPKTYSPDENGNIIEPSESSIRSMLTQASEASCQEGKSIAKYASYGFIGALLCVLFIIVALNLYKNPVRSKESAEELSGLRVLGSLPSGEESVRLAHHIRNFKNQNGDAILVEPAAWRSSSLEGRTLSSIETNCDTKSGTLEVDCVCFVPASKDRETITAAKHAASLLQKTRALDPVSESVESVIAAGIAESCIVVVSDFTTRSKDLKETLSELELSNSNVIGLVYNYIK